MFEREITVGGRLGLHARVAMQIADEASAIKGVTVKLIHKELEVDAKSIMGLMCMGAGPGTVLKVHAEGERAEELVGRISEILTEPDFH